MLFLQKIKLLILLYKNPSEAERHFHLASFAFTGHSAQLFEHFTHLFKLAEERGEKPFFIVCDELEDPHNLGAIIRTAECAGAHGVIIPKRRSVGLTATVAKASAGAVEYLPVARVPNIAAFLDEIKEKGVWVMGADMDGEDYTAVDFDLPCALVIGNEGKGIGALTAKKCDRIISLPMKGKINS